MDVLSSVEREWRRAGVSEILIGFNKSERLVLFTERVTFSVCLEQILQEE